MIGYIVCIILISTIVSIITEQMVIRRMQVDEGIDVIKGRCRMKQGYGLLPTKESQESDETSETPEGRNNLFRNMYL